MLRLMRSTSQVTQALNGLLWPLDPGRQVDFTSAEGIDELRTALSAWNLLLTVEAQLGQPFEALVRSPSWIHALTFIADLLRFTEHQSINVERQALSSIGLYPMQGVTEDLRALRRTLRAARTLEPALDASVMERGTPSLDEEGRVWMVYQTYADPVAIERVATLLRQRGLLMHVVDKQIFGPVVTLLKVRVSDGEHGLQLLLDAQGLNVVPQASVDLANGEQYVPARHQLVHRFEVS